MDKTSVLISKNFFKQLLLFFWPGGGRRQTGGMGLNSNGHVKVDACVRPTKVHYVHTHRCACACWLLLAAVSGILLCVGALALIVVCVLFVIMW